MGNVTGWVMSFHAAPETKGNVKKFQRPKETLCVSNM